MIKGLGAVLGLAALLALSGCIRSEDEVRPIADESVATLLASLPTATPAPTATQATISFTPTLPTRQL